MQYFKFVNWRIEQFLFCCHKQVKWLPGTSWSSMIRVWGSSSSVHELLYLRRFLPSPFLDLKLELRLMGIRLLPDELVDFTVLPECEDLKLIIDWVENGANFLLHCFEFYFEEACWFFKCEHSSSALLVIVFVVVVVHHQVKSHYFVTQNQHPYIQNPPTTHPQRIPI